MVETEGGIFLNFLTTSVVIAILLLMAISVLTLIMWIIQNIYNLFIKGHIPKIKAWFSPKSEIDKANKIKEKEIRLAEEEKKKYERYKKLVKKQEKIDRELEQEDLEFKAFCEDGRD